jgi:hypothetical protein
MDRQTDGQTYRWTDRERQTDGQTERDRQMDKQTDSWMNKLTDRWIDKRMDRRTERANVLAYSFASSATKKKLFLNGEIRNGTI